MRFLGLFAPATSCDRAARRSPQDAHCANAKRRVHRLRTDTQRELLLTPWPTNQWPAATANVSRRSLSSLVGPITAAAGRTRPPSVARPARRSGCSSRRRRANWKPLAQRSFDAFSVCSEHNPLPLHDAGTLAILSHYVRVFVKNLDKAVGLCPYEVIRRERRLVLFHPMTRIAGTQTLLL
jgi:hypothetical protein